MTRSSTFPEPVELIIESFEGHDGEIVTEHVFIKAERTDAQHEEFLRDWAAGRRRMKAVTTTTWEPMDG